MIPGSCIVYGKLGGGKSKFAVKCIREALEQGRPVATNLNLRLDELMPEHSRATVVRLPDKPRLEDFEALGPAYPVDEGYDETRFGLLVLDECSTWLNSRAWQDKERLPVLNWTLHSRKHGWYVMFLAQSPDVLDKQLASQVCEYLVSCRALKKMRWPFIGRLLSVFSDRLAHLPAVHFAQILYDVENPLPFDSEFYRGKDLEAAYDTRQVFESGLELVGGELRDMRASYCYLSAWHLKGRYKRGSVPRDPVIAGALEDIAIQLGLPYQPERLAS